MITHIVGNRPQFIKLAPLYHELEKRGFAQNIIHSGQHYDVNMSEVFFEELGIPAPYMNLMVGSGSHAEMTAKVMTGLEKELSAKRPDLVILYGDTNTTLAGALVVSKLNIPMAHIESGPRTHHKDNPEECNRIVTDHLADILFCSDRVSVENLEREGLGERAHQVGDIMYDTYLSVADKTDKEKSQDEIVLMTWHRQENTASKERMESILNLVEKIGEQIICPLHPRTCRYLKEYGLMERAQKLENFQMIEPVGYIEMVGLMQRAKLIITDSGGVSKESSFAGAKCLFLLDLDVWEDLMREEWIVKIDPEKEESVKKALQLAKEAVRIPPESRPRYYGDGHAAAKIVSLLMENGFI